MGLAIAALVIYTACRSAGNPAAPTAAIEINAVPWGTVKSVASTNGRVTFAVNSQTPLRVKVPPGSYDIVIFGPKGQEQTPTVMATDGMPGRCAPVFEAIDGKQIIAALPAQPVGADTDAELVDGLGAYYQGNFELAESSLRHYLEGNAQRRGLAQFYLGATMITRYSLADGEGGTQSLRAESQHAFRLARQEQNFAPPDRYISPKIIAAYENTPR